jgi:hypothetical protein
MFEIQEPVIRPKGKKCDGEQYKMLFRACLAEVKRLASAGKVTNSDNALEAFWSHFSKVSAEYHVGSAGIATYSAPFVDSIRGGKEKGGQISKAS